jgi:hypothetical protein
VLANDTFEGTPTVTGKTDGAHGTVSINVNNTVVYTPIADFNGTDSFSYTVTSGGVTETATVNVTVNAIADIVNDNVSVAEDSGANSLNLLGNDTFENSNRAITAVGAAAHGTTSINNNGTPGNTADDFVVYTPAADYNGPDAFTYTVTSGGVTETATVNVTVTAVADIVNDTAVLSEDTPGSIFVLANDTFEGTPAITGTTNGAHGTVAVNNNGTPGNTADDFIVYTQSVPDFNGTDSFTYTVTSGGLTETATVNVTISPVADIVNDAATTRRDTAVDVLVLANDTFENIPAITGTTNGAHGTVAVNTHGTASTADDSIIYTPNLNFFGPDAFTYTVTSGGVTETATVNVNVGSPPAFDFNADGRGDILWQNVNGTPAVWLLNGTAVSAFGPALVNPGASWHEIDSADFNADGKSDILWQNADGTPAVWLMDGVNLLSPGPALPNPGPTWHADEAADFNGDGKADILWQNNDGTPAVWLMDGVNVLSFGPALANPGPTWQVKDAADFNGDGKADILWQNANGTPAVWLMNGTDTLQFGPALPNPGPTWHEIAAGDFNGDGKADILWQNSDGTPAVWLVDGVNVLSFGPALPNPGASWHAVEAEDANGDGKADILWQNTDGTPAVWLMNGTAVSAFGPALLNPGSDWHII